MTRIEIISGSDTVGGASRAAYRLFCALRDTGDMARMTVADKRSDDWRITGPDGAGQKAACLLRPKIGGRFVRLQKTANPNPHSANILPSGRARAVNRSDTDIVNLHWIGGEMMSIEDIGRIRKPVVWTLHDMWPFCGAEHYSDREEGARWRSGYARGNRPDGSGGFDIDRHTWRRKRRAWTAPMHIVAPSRWLSDCVRQSELMRDWPVSVVPNVLDTSVFKPLDRGYCRDVLNLPQDKHIILFGALGGGRDVRKGYDLLLGALSCLDCPRQDILCLVFGQGKPEQPAAIPFPVRWMGHIGDDATLALLYNAATVMITPSRQENLPQSATEAHACACPVGAFRCTGMPDVVDHKVTGYLAEPYDTRDLANGIAWMLADSGRLAALGAAARHKAQRRWSAGAVLPAYRAVFEAAASLARDTTARPGLGFL
jgi:glycosyltransferase involved in cell wall biosynthesis